MAKNGDTQSQLGPIWQAPDIAFCRAIRLGGEDDLVYCLMEDAYRCAYAVRFGSGFFCRHPNRVEITARTKANRGR